MSQPFSLAKSSSATKIAEAPSFRVDALPAVTMPSSWKTGFRPASFSAVVPARTPSSVESSGMSNLSQANQPLASACAALFWERAAKASIFSREILHSLATISPVLPM